MVLNKFFTNGAPVGAAARIQAGCSGAVGSGASLAEKACLRLAHLRPFPPMNETEKQFFLTHAWTASMKRRGAKSNRILVGLLVCLSSAADQQPSEKREYPITIDWDRIDIQVAGDGTSTEIRNIARTINTEAAMSQGAGQISIPYKVGSKEVEVLEAATLKPDGRRIAVSQSEIFSKESPISVGAPMFSDVKIKVVVFPDVSVGDQLLLGVKTVQKPSLGSHFGKLICFPRDVLFRDIEVKVRAPSSYQLFVQAVDMEGGRIGDSSGQAQWLWKAQVKDPVTGGHNSVALLDYSPRVVISSMPDFVTLAAAFQKGATEKAKMTPEIQALADELTAGISDPRAQTKALYNWVCRQIRYVGVWLGDGGFVPHDVRAVLESRYGDCKDHAVLFQSLLAAKGIESSPALINSGRSYWKPAVAVAESFNHVITYIPALNLYLDSTSQFAPFGILPFEDEDKFVVLTRDGLMAKTPRCGPQDNAMDTKVAMRLLSNGSVEGSSVITFKGACEVFYRANTAHIRAGTESQFVSGQLSRCGQSGTGTLQHSNPHDLGMEFSIASKFHLVNAITLPGPGATTIPAGFVWGSLAESEGRVIGIETQETPFVGRCLMRTEEYSLEFPATAQVTKLPKNVQFSNPLDWSSALARRTSGIGNWGQPKHTTCRGRLIWENPTYSAFWSVFGATCLRLQRLASSVGFGTTAGLGPRKNLPYSGVSSEPGGCYATLERGHP